MRLYAATAISRRVYFHLYPASVNMADEHFGVTPSSVNSIPIFDPRQDDPRQWLDKIERHARVFQWSKVDKLLVARCRLSGDAPTWESGIDGDMLDMRDWPEFRAMFLERFAPRLGELFNRHPTVERVGMKVSAGMPTATAVWWPSLTSTRPATPLTCTTSFMAYIPMSTSRFTSCGPLIWMMQ